jgi:uncharacterized MAPEG superfamily protein
MLWIELVTLLAVLQFLVMGIQVGGARRKTGIHAPATTGDPLFERYFRAHMNTLETLIVFLPSLWIAARHWSPMWMALLGVVYLVGRHLYFAGYVKDAGKRSFGYMLSAGATSLLLVAGLAGIVWTWMGRGV